VLSALSSCDEDQQLFSINWVGGMHGHTFAVSFCHMSSANVFKPHVTNRLSLQLEHSPTRTTAVFMLAAEQAAAATAETQAACSCRFLSETARALAAASQVN
jgi:hypothetical protein